MEAGASILSSTLCSQHEPDLNHWVLRPLPLPDDISGKLWLSSMPGRFEPLEDFLGWCRTSVVNEVVCLVGNTELLLRSPSYAKALQANQLPFSVTQFPVPDRGVPKDATGLVELAREIAERLRSGGRIVVHCAAGVGRTGLFSTIVLMATGMPLQLALLSVKEARSGPETEEQRALLEGVTIQLTTQGGIR